MEPVYELSPVTAPTDWEQYHEIRRMELFERKGRPGTYNPEHPNEKQAGNQPLLFKRNGVGIGTVRLDSRADGSFVVRLVAITQDEQGKGEGRKLMEEVEIYARAHGAQKLVLNADKDAVGFYERLGFLPDSWDPSELTGISIDSVQMSKTLAH